MLKFKKNVYFKYTILFLFCGSIMYIPFLVLRRSLIASWDSFNQEYPLFVYIGKYIRDCLTGTVRQFDFRIGLGDDVIAALNWHGFGDFLQVISALFPVADSELGYGLVMGLKFYLCGITFLVYAKRYLAKDSYLLSGALLYAFSVFSLVKGLEFWVFLNPIITFPLILYGIDQIRENRRRLSYLFITALFLQALSGFYFLYMEAIMAVVYFLIVHFCDGSQDRRERFRSLLPSGLAVAMQALLGIGLGAFILLPAVWGYLDSSRTGRSTIFDGIKDMLLYEHDYYLKHLRCFMVPEAWESIVTISPVVLLGLIAVFTTRKLCPHLKAICIISLIGFCLPVVGSLMNGFSYCTDRWYFGVLFFLIMTALMGIEKIRQLKKGQMLIFLLMAVALILGNIAGNSVSKGVFLRSLAFLFFIIILPIIWNCQKKEQLLLASVCLLTVLNGWLIFGPNQIGGSGYTWGFVPMEESLTSMQESVAGIDKQDRFERLDVYQSSLATAMVMDYYGTTEYFSTLNGDVSEFYREMGISPGVRSATWILKGLDSREELLSLLSVGQYTDFEVNEEGIVPCEKTNENYLPLGFTYSEWISRENFDSFSVAQKESMILKAIVLEEPLPDVEETAIDISEENQEIGYQAEDIDIERDGNCFTTRCDSRIRITLEESAESESVYVQFKGFTVEDEGVHELYVGNKNLQLRSRDYVYYMGSDEFWVYVTELFEEDGVTYFDLRFPEENTFTLQDMKIYEHKVDGESVQKRGEHVLKDLVFETNSIIGKIQVDQPECLFLSIPYSTGWKAYVDGQKVDVLKANIGFVAVKIPQGEHDVRFVYETPGLRLGIIVSIIALSILILTALYERKGQVRSR